MPFLNIPRTSDVDGGGMWGMNFPEIFGTTTKTSIFHNLGTFFLVVTEIKIPPVRHCLEHIYFYAVVEL